MPLLIVIQSGRIKAQTKLPAKANQVVLLLDGKLIATVGVDGDLQLWRGMDENGVIDPME
jgi:hypothetical protein